MSLTYNTLVKACEFFQFAPNYTRKGRKNLLYSIFLYKQAFYPTCKTPWGLLMSDKTRKWFWEGFTVSVRPVPLNSLSLNKEC